MARQRLFVGADSSTEEGLLQSFYAARSKSGVPERGRTETTTTTTTRSVDTTSTENGVEEDTKLPPASTGASSSSPHSGCPLPPGRYYILPRAWCHGWRRYIRTGETSDNHNNDFSNNNYKYPAPDATSLLCQAHRLVLLPPHLEAYLNGEQAQLLVPSTAAVRVATTTTRRSNRVVDADCQQALLAAGLTPAQVSQQLAAMHRIEQLQQQQQQQVDAAAANTSTCTNLTKKERLDRENHVVVEIVTEAEFQALLVYTGDGNSCSTPNNTVVGTTTVSCSVSVDGMVTFEINYTNNNNNNNNTDDFSSCGSSSVCRACNATGRRDCDVLWPVKKAASKPSPRMPLEY
jgi:hypothetical protein